MGLELTQALPAVLPRQYWSELMTSAPLRLPRANHVCGPIESLIKCTDPSAKHTFTPPE